MDLKKTEGFSSVRELALTTLYYISGSIFGPLILFLGLGYILDKIFQTRPTMFLIGFFVAFVTSNVLLFKKVSEVNKLIGSYKSAEKKEDEKSSSLTKTETEN